MSEDKSSKTEQPTPKRLRDARNKGQVAKSREIVSTALTISIFIFFWFSWPYQLERCKEIILLPTQFYHIPFAEALKTLSDLLLLEFVYLVLPLIVLVIAIGLLANTLQFGLLFAVETVVPKLEKLSPIKGLQRIFSARTVIEAVKSIIKMILISTLLFFVIKNSISDLVQMPVCDIACLTAVTSALMGKIVLYVTPGFIVIAVIDYLFQKAQHIKDNKMTKEEVKKEYKDREGDPIVKGQRQQLHQQLVTDNTLQAVKQASVLITGSHSAVALWYDKDKTIYPVIVATGKQLVAEQMVKMAQAAGVSIVADLALTQGLAQKGTVGLYIPKEFIDASAEVLRQALAQQ